MTLQEMIAQYKTSKKDKYTTYLNSFKKIDEKQLLKIIARMKCIDTEKLLLNPPKGKGKLIFPEGMFKKEPHQYHINLPELIDELEKIINPKFYGTIKQMKKSNKDFEYLYAYVEANIGHLKNAGELLIYDIALRLGASIGILPKKYVYASRGALKGLNSIGLKISKCISIENIPCTDLKELSAYHIENFACSYHNELSTIVI